MADKLNWTCDGVNHFFNYENKLLFVVKRCAQGWYWFVKDKETNDGFATNDVFENDKLAKSDVEKFLIGMIEKVELGMFKKLYGIK